MAYSLQAGVKFIKILFQLEDTIFMQYNHLICIMEYVYTVGSVKLSLLPAEYWVLS